MFVREIDDDTTGELEGDSVTESDSVTDDDDEQTSEQNTLESDATVDTNTDELSDDATDDDDEIDSDATTFNRAYVEKLRRESAGYRERAQRADELAARLHSALVAATGRMADPSDLAFDAAHLDDEQALTNAIDELLARKPHLATRRPFGDVGQGNRGGTVEPANLADMLRARA